MPGQLTLAHASFPNALRHSRVMSTSHARLPSGDAEVIAIMNALSNSQGPCNCIQEERNCLPVVGVLLSMVVRAILNMTTSVPLRSLKEIED